MHPVSKRKTSEIHSAKASMAGFLFQLRRALCRLAGAPEGTSVSIETLDDVVIDNKDGFTIIEQDKLSFQRNPVPDRSENLWKTLTIWMDLLEGGEVQIDHTNFHLVSTFPIKTGIAAMLKNSPADRDNGKIVKELLKIAHLPSADFESYAKKIKKWPVAKLLGLIKKITVTDASCADSKDELTTKLNLDASIRDDVIKGLSGWLLDMVLDSFASLALNEVEPTTFSISCKEFQLELNKLIAKHFNRQIVLRASQDIVSPKQIAIDANRDARFVKQLQLLKLGDDEGEYILDAIVDFLKADEETTRLAKKNEVTKSKFRDYEQQLREHWQYCWRSAKLKPCVTEELTGQYVLNEAMQVKSTLDDQPVTHSYLNHGTYHSMANTSKTPHLGWHPQYHKLLGNVP